MSVSCQLSDLCWVYPPRVAWAYLDLPVIGDQRRRLRGLPWWDKVFLPRDLWESADCLLSSAIRVLLHVWSCLLLTSPFLYIICKSDHISVVPHKAVAEVSKIGNLFVHLFIYLHLSLSISLSPSLSLSLSPSPSLSIYPSICLSVYLSICLSVWVSVYQSVYLCICLSLSVCLSVYLSIYLSICRSIYLYICQSICISIYLSIYISVNLSICLSVLPSLLKLLKNPRIELNFTKAPATKNGTWTPTSGPNVVRFTILTSKIFNMCFALQGRALFRRLNVQKWSKTVSFSHFWHQNVLRATTACTFWASGLPEVLCFAPSPRCF